MKKTLIFLNRKMIEKSKKSVRPKLSSNTFLGHNFSNGAIEKISKVQKYKTPRKQSLYLIYQRMQTHLYEDLFWAFWVSKMGGHLRRYRNLRMWFDDTDPFKKSLSKIISFSKQYSKKVVVSVTVMMIVKIFFTDHIIFSKKGSIRTSIIYSTLWRIFIS